MTQLALPQPLHFVDDLEATDLFCGAGGSAIGLHNAGFKVKIAANHWKMAVDTHADNFPDTEHDLADISQVDPRRYPSTQLLWCSPECTNHSIAKGVSKKLMRDTVAQGLPVESAARSRATAWDCVRFSESMMNRGTPYLWVVVENVVDFAHWGVGGNGSMYRTWVQAMENMGYEYDVVYLNSMFAGGGRYSGILPAPQSRDRHYACFTLKGAPKPNLDFRPMALCPEHGHVYTVQTWKSGRTSGRYRAQYTYNCPTCAVRLEPFTRGAIEAIDWNLPGIRIGDRTRALSDATMKRVAAGIEKFAGHPGYIVPVERGNDPRKMPRSLFEALPTQTARATQAVAFTPFIASIRGGGSKNKVDAVTDPMATISAGGNHHLLAIPPGFVMRHNNSSSPSSTGAEMCTPFDEPLRTLTTKGMQSLVYLPPHLTMGYSRTSIPRPVDEPMHTLRTHDSETLLRLAASLDDVELRMLQPHEQAAGMAIPQDYKIRGSKRERTKQIGNAVTPPASELIATAIVDAVRGVERQYDAAA